MNKIATITIGVSKARKIKSRGMQVFIMAMAMMAIIPLFFVFYHVVSLGAPALTWDFFTSLPKPVGESGGGMANSLVGSLVMVLLGTLMGVPIGVMGGVFLSEYGKGKIASFLRFSVDMMTSIPSIIIGLFVYAILVVPMKSFSAYAGALSLCLLLFPFVVKTTEEVLKLIPSHIREAGLALGISRWRVTMQIILRGALPSVMTGVILGIARIAGETAPLLFTAFGNRNWPRGLSEPIPSLPVQIYSYAISPFEEWHQQAWAGSFLLLLVVFVFNVLAPFQ